MPLIEERELEIYIGDGTIHTYTIDTNIFFSLYFNFKKFPLSSTLHPHEKITLVLPEIIYYKMINKFLIGCKDIEDIKKQLNNFLPLIGIQEIQDNLNSINLNEACKQAIDTYLYPKENYILHASDYADIDKIVQLYIQCAPPFSKNKKCEFPDAIALLTLEGYANKMERKILTVSRDKDWIDFCRDSHVLYALKENYSSGNHLLIKCLDNFNKLDEINSKMIDNVKRLIEASTDVQKIIQAGINAFFSENLESFEPLQELPPLIPANIIYDAEMTKIKLESIDYSTIELGAAYKSDCELDLYAPVKVNILCQANFAEYMPDTESMIYKLISNKSAQVNADIDIILEISAQIESHDIDNIKITECNVSPDDWEIDFGVI